MYDVDEIYLCPLQNGSNRRQGEREREREGERCGTLMLLPVMNPKLVECWYCKRQIMGGWRELPVVYVTSRANPVFSLSVGIVSAANYFPKHSSQLFLGCDQCSFLVINDEQERLCERNLGVSDLNSVL